MFFQSQLLSMIYILKIVNIIYGQSLQSLYNPEKVLIKAFKPAGLHISVPDVKGISLVAYHVKFNEKFNGLEAGTIARDIVEQKNGRWTYEDKTTVLKKGDCIHYWIHTIYDGLGYNLINQKYRIDEFYNSNGTKVRPPIVKPFKPSGIHISIPDEEGISLVAFHAKLNEDFNGLEAGTIIARDIVNPIDGRWTYEDKKTKLRKYDVIYFWLHIIYNGLGYNVLNQRHVVKDYYYYNGSLIQ